MPPRAPARVAAEKKSEIRRLSSRRLYHDERKKERPFDAIKNGQNDCRVADSVEEDGPGKRPHSKRPRRIRQATSCSYVLTRPMTDQRESMSLFPGKQNRNGTNKSGRFPSKA